MATMLKLNIFVWMVLAIVFYAFVAFLIDHVSRTYYPERCISRPKRRLPKLPKGRFVLLFLVNSMQTGMIVWAALALSENGWGRLYALDPLSAINFFIILLQIFFILFVFDTQYYWLHRLFHGNKLLYRHLHAEHHEVRFPRTWHLHYQSPLEWFLTTTSPMLLLAILPIPLSLQAYLSAIAISAFINTGGHAGHEVSRTPLAIATFNGWASYIDPQRRWIAKLFNNVLHHDLHHQKVVVNYSLYFTWWDRIAGSMDHNTDRVSQFISQKNDPVVRTLTRKQTS